MKRLLLISMMILALCLSVSLAEEESVEWHTGAGEVWNDAGEHFSYVIEDDHAVLTRYWVEKGMPQPPVVQPPEALGGLPLTAIGPNVFNDEYMGYNGEMVSRIVIPEGVTELRADSFDCAHDIPLIELPSTLAEISPLYPFHHVQADIRFPNGNARYRLEEGFLIDIRTDTLIYCSASARELPLPRVRRIGDSALENYSFYQTILEFPDSVEYIGSYNAYDCVDLEAIIVPGSVVELADHALSINTASEIILNEGLRRIGAFAFEQTEITEIRIPSSVEWIGWYAFFLTHVEDTLPELNVHMETEEEYASRTGEDE